MITIKQSITIKYKLAGSVFESINEKAYATNTRSLGTTKALTSKLLSNPTLLDTILPIIIGNNNKNSEWEHEKLDYVSSIQISIGTSGLVLDLNHVFDLTSPQYKESISKYIKDYKLDKDATEEVICKHIVSNKHIDEVDYHLYFRYTNVKDYLYYLVALNSSQVANKADDADKSPNIRFFLYDEKVAKARQMSAVDNQSKAINKLIALRAKDNSESLLKDILVLQNTVSFDEIEDMTPEDVYLELFRYANIQASEFLAIIETKDVELNALIKKYIDINVLAINSDNEIINASTSEVIGKSIESVILYFKNPINKGEVTQFESKYKSLKKQ